MSQEAGLARLPSTSTARSTRNKGLFVHTAQSQLEQRQVPPMHRASSEILGIRRTTPQVRDKTMPWAGASRYGRGSPPSLPSTCAHTATGFCSQASTASPTAVQKLLLLEAGLPLCTAPPPPPCSRA